MPTTKLNNGQLPDTISSKTVDNTNDINTTTTRLKISGGSNGQVLSTDGSSNLSWTTAAGVQIQVDTFTSSGTWTKPSWAKKVEVYLLSGGGGGGSGARQATTVNRFAGAGGMAGTITYANLIASNLGATESITIGAGGTGGASVTTNNTAGNIGTVGGRTLFGSVFQAPTSTRSGTELHYTADSNRTLIANQELQAKGYQPPRASSGTTTQTPTENHDFQKSGGGGAYQSANVTTARAGLSASSSYSNGTRGYFQTATTGAAGGTDGGNGADGSGSVTAFGLTLGNGGGGGSYKTAQATGNGGNASNYGAGGGGGAGSDNGFNSGAGGNGSGGMAVVISIG